LAMHRLEIAQQRRAALLDNTTLAGAEIALTRPSEATLSDEQSLADLLEAIVLHESLVADDWFGNEEYPLAVLRSGIFDQFESVDAIPRGSKLKPTEDGLRMFVAGLVRAALDRLERSLRSGGLEQQYELIATRLRAGRIVSPLYAAPRDLREEIIELCRTRNAEVSGWLDERQNAPIRDLERAIAMRFDGAPDGFVRYAIFMMRAFYYEELADEFSLSYVPHTFRAHALLTLPREGNAPPTAAFATYATRLAAATRRELAGFDVTLDFPPIAARLARDVASRGYLVQAALELRETESAREFRRWVSDQQRLVRLRTEPLKVENAKRELTAIVSELGVELLGHRREHGHPITLRITLGVPPITAQLSSDEIQVVVATGASAPAAVSHVFLAAGPRLSHRTRSAVQQAATRPSALRTAPP
jgi:hypothetical protein